MDACARELLVLVFVFSFPFIYLYTLVKMLIYHLVRSKFFEHLFLYLFLLNLFFLLQSFLFSDVGDEAILSTLWVRYESAFDKVCLGFGLWVWFVTCWFILVW